jgi:AcrR family transcriptional regulator
VTKQEWLAIAERVLVQRGPAALTIDELTRRAGVTKGSFYHHFGSQPGFVDAFLDHLAHLGFEEVVARLDTHRPALDQLRQLAGLIAEHDPTLERAVRRWGVISPAVAGLLGEVDRMRLDFWQQMFARVTGDQVLALSLARLNLALYLGSLQIDPPIRGSEYVDLSRALEQLLPGRAT